MAKEVSIMKQNGVRLLMAAFLGAMAFRFVELVCFNPSALWAQRAGTADVPAPTPESAQNDDGDRGRPDADG